MADWKIGRLTLRLPGVSRADGESLARRVAEDLATRTLTPRSARRVETVRQNVPGLPGETVDSLAARIVDQLVRSLERMV